MYLHAHVAGGGGATPPPPPPPKEALTSIIDFGCYERVGGE